MRTKDLTLLAALLLVPCPGSAALVAVPDGDSDALLAAISAGTDEPTTILLARAGHYLWPSGAITVDGNVVIEGNNSTISGAELNTSRMLTVSEKGKMVLKNLRVEAFSDGGVLRGNFFGMVENHGSMVLESVGFRQI